jgi:CBS domain-containing protein
MPSTSTVKAACQRMADQRAGSVLIADDEGALLGIFTGRDAVGRVIAEGKSPSRTRLSEVMTANPVTMTSQQTAIDALRLMWDGGFRHVPVVDDGKIRGVVSRGDFNASEQDRLEGERALWEHLR